MKKFLNLFERYIITALLIMMILVVFLNTIELSIILLKELLNPPFMLLDINNILDIFGYFLTILIGLELIDATKIYLVEEVVHVEVIFLVAIIAIARKVIILDVKALPPVTLFGIASIILSLSVGYYLLKQALNTKK
ncbi:MAG: phosphate-starvation-inducible PsiE family protein [Gomphosphaeria aponina SAG 52.96 = DSM 107014]|uniref:Phosphate-starvation-inducible PsiE family protein n=1 Tax=Gomphosphaeria aponina SAG 52.96 = DSM 107014 TaxID=1521640 RepID=A0A941JLY1_9CHRO|nr:phosphate-starvation-inducible PsiE family protein [Gomphosphaeria aponina SAG 52.96 = DSM 107014]